MRSEELAAAVHFFPKYPEINTQTLRNDKPKHPDKPPKIPHKNNTNTQKNNPSTCLPTYYNISRPLSA